MIYYVKILINFFLWLLSNNFFLSLFIINIILIISTFSLQVFRKQYYKITLQDMKIRNKILTAVTLFVIFCFFCSLFIYWRLSNLGKFVDLKSIIFKLHLIFVNKSFFSFLITVIFIVLFTMLLIQIILLLQKFLFYYILKIHIYLMVYTLKDSPMKITSYEKLINNLHTLKLYPFMIEKRVLRIMYYMYVKIKYGSYQGNFENFWIMLFSQTNYCYYKQRLDKYLIISSILYDIFFNNMIIHKIYYILPITFCFYLNDKFLDIAAFIEKTDCIQVHAYLTKKIKQKNYETYIFEDNTNASIEDIKNINRKILRDNVENDYDKYKEHFKYKKSLFIFALIILYTIIGKHIILTFHVFETTFNIHIIVILLLSLFIQMIFWLLANNYKFMSFFYLIFYIFGLFIPGIIFFKHNVPLLYNEVDKYFFIQINDIYCLEEKITFLKEYFKYRIQSNSMKNKQYLYMIIEKLPLKDFIMPHTSIAQLREYVESFLIIHKKYENLILFIWEKQNNNISDFIALQNYQEISFPRKMKMFLHSLWNSLKIYLR